MLNPIKQCLEFNEESSGDINYVLCTLSAASYRFLMKGFFPRSLP